MTIFAKPPCRFATSDEGCENDAIVGFAASMDNGAVLVNYACREHVVPCLAALAELVTKIADHGWEHVERIVAESSGRGPLDVDELRRRLAEYPDAPEPDLG